MNNILNVKFIIILIYIDLNRLEIEIIKFLK